MLRQEWWLKKEMPTIRPQKHFEKKATRACPFLHFQILCG
jgi:hypothetical protein